MPSNKRKQSACPKPRANYRSAGNLATSPGERGHYPMLSIELGLVSKVIGVNPP